MKRSFTQLIITFLFFTIAFHVGALNYDVRDQMALSSFLWQNSATPGVINAEKLGLTKEDMETVGISEEWIEKLVGVTWNDGHLTAISWIMKSLGGNLNLLGCTSLTSLNCSFNGSLKSVTVSGCTNLTSLNCSFCSLDDLDVTENPKLTALNCGFNSLASLNLSANTALTSLDCGSCLLSALNVTNCTKLERLICSSNGLTALTIGTKEKLTELDCSTNQLTALDVAGYTMLKTFNCGNNQLTELDVKNNRALTSLICFNNQLTTLDVSKLTALDGLYCDNNQLTALDVSKLSVLTELTCENNYMPLSAIYTWMKNAASPSFRKTCINQQLVLFKDKTISSDQNLDLSSEAVFDGVNTVFTVKNGNATAEPGTDYTIANGIITFLKGGSYTVEMTNQKVTDNSGVIKATTGVVTVIEQACKCTSDPECVDLYCPATISQMEVGKPVAQTITVNVPFKYDVSGMSVDIVKIGLPETIENVPAGLDWCVSATELLPGNSYCCYLSGTPQQEGTYTIEIPLKITVSLFGNEVPVDYPIKFTFTITGMAVGVEDRSNKDVILYPNPTRDVVEIMVDVTIKDIQIFNLEGKLIYQGKNKVIDVSSVPTGIYNVRIIDMDGNRTLKKLIVRD